MGNIIPAIFGGLVGILVHDEIFMYWFNDYAQRNHLEFDSQSTIALITCFLFPGLGLFIGSQL